MKRHITTKITGAPALAALSLVGALLAGTPARADAAPAPNLSAKADAFLAHALIGHAPGRSSVILKLGGGGLTAARQAALARLGADITRRLPLIGSVSATVPTRSLARVAALPFVARLSADLAVQKCDEFTEASSGADTAFQQYGLTGKGVTVAVVDSGVFPYADLSGSGNNSRVLAGVSFVPGDPSTFDACGHGTHVAGIAAGNGAYSSGNFRYTHSYYGVARQAGLVGVRVLDKNGSGSVTTVLSGLQWAVANKAKYHIGVINLSLGHPVGESYKTDPLCQAVEAAWKAGIVVVCAAGNSGRANALKSPGAANEGWGTAYGSINSPGNDPSVITVGAMKSVDGNRAHDLVASYSGRGPSRLDLVLKPDIMAPGNQVVSLGTAGSYLYNAFPVNQIPMASYCPGVGGPSQTYFKLSGTSMAAPVVAGAAALLLQWDPKLTPDTVKARLMVTADKWAAPDANGNPKGAADPCTYGAGYLNIPAALASGLVASQPALSPTLVTDAKGNVSINASGIMSASHIIWGTSVNDLHIIWGTNAISGASTLTASHIIWGTSGVFADHIIWGTCLTGGVDLTSTAISGEGAAVQKFQAGACPLVDNPQGSNPQ